jgi:hypothetical protein
MIYLPVNKDSGMGIFYCMRIEKKVDIAYMVSLREWVESVVEQ